METIKHIDKYGTIRYSNTNKTKLHNLDGPAVIYQHTGQPIHRYYINGNRLLKQEWKSHRHQYICIKNIDTILQS